MPQSKDHDKRLPDIPPRPDGVDPAAFHSNQFGFFEDFVHENGFDDNNPAVIHSPVLLYARTGPENDPCYPESALNANGDGPNPGQSVPVGPNPGESCTDPGDYHGDYSKGNQFPVYVGMSYCEQTAEWRVNYDAYYVHDGNSNAGHRHDWEGISVVFGRDPNHYDPDWYMAKGVIFNRHSHHDYYDWKDVQTIFSEDDVREETFGTLKKHPKVYVGLFSHASFREKCDIGCASLINAQEISSETEYRSSDWYRIVPKEDLRLFDEVHGDWDYGDATSTPWANKNGQCGWDVQQGFTHKFPRPQDSPSDNPPCGHWRSRDEDAAPSSLDPRYAC